MLTMNEKQKEFKDDLKKISPKDPKRISLSSALHLGNTKFNNNNKENLQNERQEPSFMNGPIHF